MRWRARSHRQRNAASSFVRLPPSSPDGWRALLGRKISIRYRTGDPELPFSEAIGVVAAVDDADGTLSIDVMDRRGSHTVVTSDQVEAGKVFPVAGDA